MRKEFILSLFFCLSLLAKAEDKLTHIIVWAKDGTRVAYALDKEPMITFSETDMIIATKDIEVNYALENMDRITYGDSNASGIRNINSGEPIYRWDGEALIFPSLVCNSTVSLYSLNGMMVFTENIKESGEYFFSLSNLNTGIYVVKVNNITYKLIKK